MPQQSGLVADCESFSCDAARRLVKIARWTGTVSIAAHTARASLNEQT